MRHAAMFRQTCLERQAFARNLLLSAQLLAIQTTKSLACVYKRV